MMKALVFILAGVALIVDVLASWENAIFVLLIAIIIALVNLDRGKE